MPNFSFSRSRLKNHTLKLLNLQRFYKKHKRKQGILLMQEEIPLSPTRQTALASGAVAATAEVLPDDLFEIQVNDPLHIAHALQKRFENGQRVTWLGSDAAVFISNIENNSSNSNESSFNDRKDMNIFPNYSLSPPNLPSITNLIYHHIFLDKRNRTILFR